VRAWSAGCDRRSVIAEVGVADRPPWPSRLNGQGRRLDPSSEVLVADCSGQRAWWWFAPDHQLELVEPGLTAAWSREGDLVRGAITTDAIVRDLTVYPDRLVPGATIDRQLVSLLPGETCIVTIAGLGDADPAALLVKPYCWSAVF
jgi:beta-mannosidase